MSSIFQGLNDAQWAVLSPVITYWILSGFYEILDAFDLFSQYRIRPKDVDRGQRSKENTISWGEVVREVVIAHIVQSAILVPITARLPAWRPYNNSMFQSSADLLAIAVIELVERCLPPTSSAQVIRLGSGVTIVLWLLARQFLALVVTDTWTFWMHYILHRNKWLYRKVHSVHHQLYVPFASGALYNHWFESVCSDGMGAVAGVAVAGLTGREAIWYLAFTTGKAVEDHCGFNLPWSPFTAFGRWTGATAVYHNIHHERWGIKKNFEIYFTWWDRWLDSEYKGPRRIGGKAADLTAQEFGSKEAAE